MNYKHKMFQIIIFHYTSSHFLLIKAHQQRNKIDANQSK